jgi:hypothetical protein
LVTYWELGCKCDKRLPCIVFKTKRKEMCLHVLTECLEHTQQRPLCLYQTRAPLLVPAV